MSYPERIFVASSPGVAFRMTLANIVTIDPAPAVIVLILISTIARIALAAAVGLGTDEAYTVANARNLALSYVDYPPLHVWLVGTWSWLWHSELPVIVRLPFIALFAGSTWVMFRLAAFLFDARVGFWSALLFNLAPVFSLAHGSWVLPDGPLIFFLLSGALVVARLLFATAEPSYSFTSWLIAGSLAGLAMLSKYHGAFLPAGILAFLMSWAPGRRVLALPGPWVGATLAILVFSPVIIWNVNHDWAGLFFQTKRLTESADLNPTRVFISIAGQAGYLAPWLFIPLAIVWIRALARGPRDPRTWFLALLASGPIVTFTALTLISRGLPHWTMPGWLFVFPLLGVEAAYLAQTRPKVMINATSAALATLIAVFFVLGTNARSGWLTYELPQRLAHNDPTLDLVSWDELGTIISNRKLLNEQTPAIAATHWGEAGKLNYSMGAAIPVLCLCSDPHQFRYLYNLEHLTGRNIIVIGDHRDMKKRDPALTRWFDRIEVLPPIVLHRGGRLAIQLTAIRGVGFRPSGGPTTLASQLETVSHWAL